MHVGHHDPFVWQLTEVCIADAVTAGARAVDGARRDGLSTRCIAEGIPCRHKEDKGGKMSGRPEWWPQNCRQGYFIDITWRAGQVASEQLAVVSLTADRRAVLQAGRVRGVQHGGMKYQAGIARGDADIK